jgi:hypothetical protein
VLFNTASSFENLIVKSVWHCKNESPVWHRPGKLIDVPSRLIVPRQSAVQGTALRH